MLMDSAVLKEMLRIRQSAFIQAAEKRRVCAVTCNGNAYPFDPEDAFMLCAYGDFEIAGIDLSVFNDKSNPFIHVELELKAELVKEVLA